MRHTKVVWLLASLSALTACSGRYEVGMGEQAGTGGAGAPDASGSGGTSTGAGSSVATGARPPGGQAGASPGGGEPAACSAGTVLPPRPVVPNAAPDVVWSRISRFLLNEATPAREPLPGRVTAVWARRAAFAVLDDAEATGTPLEGLVRFVGHWMLGPLPENSPMWPFPRAWTAQLAPAHAVLGDLLAAEAGLGDAGIFTDKAFVISFQTPSARGQHLLDRLFCTPMPPPPPDVNLVIGALEPGQTRREWLEAELNQPSCTACHHFLDPLGFSLEHYDATGTYRTTENGQPVDASGILDAPTGQRFSFTSMEDLAPQLATTCDVASCFARALLDDARLRGGAALLPAAYNEVELAYVVKPFVESGFSIRTLIGEIVTSASFLGE